MRIIIFLVAGNLFAQKCRSLERLIFIVEFNLGNHKPQIIAIELIDLVDVGATLHQIATFVNLCVTTQQQQLLGLGNRNLFLPLVTAETAIERGTLDGEIALVVPDSYPHRIAILTTQITLYYSVRTESLGAIALVDNQKLTFNLQCHKTRC